MAGRPAVWAGVESASLRVGPVVRDQLAETGHDSRITDLDRLPELAAGAVRYPVLWGRGPSGRPIADGTDLRWATERLERLGRMGLEPVVELLHHGFGPPGADPLSPIWPARFAGYAAWLADRFPWVRTWLPINEPLTTARFAGLYGWWWPHHTDDTAFARLLVGQCLAIRAAARAIRARIPDATIVVNEDAGVIRGTPELADVVQRHEVRRWLTFDLLTGRVVPGHPAWSALAAVPGIGPALERLAADPEPPDLLGLDHYVTSDRWLDHRLEAFPRELHGDDHGARLVDVEAVRVAGVPVSGFEHALRSAWERYRLPLALTEVQLAGEPADQVAWWREAWAAAIEAQASGVDVRAVTAWAVFGAWDWDTVLRQHGRTWAPGCLSPEPDAAAAPLLAAIRARSTDDVAAVTATPGWWRRPDRARHHPDRGPLVAA